MRSRKAMGSSCMSPLLWMGVVPASGATTSDSSSAGKATERMRAARC
jgi:hypothetical protein